jgi:hypothetical protein
MASKILVLIGGFCVFSTSFAQVEEDTTAEAITAKNPSDVEDDDNVIKRPKPLENAVEVEFTKSEIAKACRKYEGKLVSVGSEIWKIAKCQRHLVHDPENLFQMSRKGTSIIAVDSQELASIPVGDTWESIQNKKIRPCSVLNGNYVTLSFTEIFFVERCVKRLIPDHETFIQHRKDRSAVKKDIISLTDAEFYSLKAGRPLNSVIDKEFAKLLDGSAGVDIIPIDEACKGVNNRFVSFYSRIYKIEKCRKREIDAELFTKSPKNRKLDLIELSADQWLSMPDGKPWNL